MSSYTPTSPIESPPRRLTFSLRTMFFIVTCAAIYFAGFRMAAGGWRFYAGWALLAAFLSIWSFGKGHLYLGFAFFVALLISVLVAPVFRTGTATQCDFCSHRLWQFGLAMQLYHKTHGRLPAAYAIDGNGNPLHSWRKELLPYFEEKSILDQLQIGEPWNGPHNSKFAKTVIRQYLCPADVRELPMSSFVAVVGPNTAWPSATARKLGEIKEPKRTILLIEIPNSNINWLEPRDVTIDELKNGLAGLIPPGGASPHSEGFNVLFAAGHVETLPVDIDPKKLIEMCNIDGSSDASNQ
jgi:hypothetical protein